MNQLTQKLKDGKMQVLEVPTPVLGCGMILVRNYFSLISAGTESSTVNAARKSLIGKAKERPQQVKQVLDVLVQQGPVQTYRAVMKKLDAWSPLGYSCAGEVISVASDISDFSIGDFVACGGLTAAHAEVVAVPVNLCVKLDIREKINVKGERLKNIDEHLKAAAFNTLGAIAMQGVRQADLRLGESCAVIGLGLIGQLSALLLMAGGIRVIGIDVDEQVVHIAGQHCADLAIARDTAGIDEQVASFTGGLGADAVIITAGTDSLDPVNFAGQICRKKGKVVIVGNVPTGFDRDPYYYRKELDLRMSCSYGPGRYDSAYEEKGMDYPAAYVRWTEKRNMEAFQELIHSGKIKLDYLTTHEFNLEEAPQAYDIILQKKEHYLGILIRYDTQKPIESGRVKIRPSDAAGKVGIAFIGAGSYAQSHLLPNLHKSKDVSLIGVMTSSGTSSRSVTERFGFEFCTSDVKDILGESRKEGLDSRLRGNANIKGSNSKGINTVFIATRHDSHAGYVLKALETGKHVFVEKPLCLTEDELESIRFAYQNNAQHLMVGFNRRFSPLTVMLKEKFGDGPMSMICRVNAGKIPQDSWIQDMATGGGRIIGEACHFIDLLTFINGSLPISVYAQALPDPHHLNDTITVTLTYSNGSIGTISYFSNGPKSLPKEYIEIYSAGSAGIIRDFKEIEITGAQKTIRKKLWSQDKGQKRMVQSFIEAILQGGTTPIAFDDIYMVTLTTFKILESLRTGQSVKI
ncbi:MAG: oxidoreductase [Deltaproteobacteria bacterium HGW-Deltaproteobacteria-13]|jgi:predicted dehydrogenase/threonine dehydrogenase-like Zn-dependent dehydrogenase|nr:MAG: oxidoreductase [Deltaproteobacteria bacterium HGW-Deltaproteobacteria-13]